MQPSTKGIRSHIVSGGCAVYRTPVARPSHQAGYRQQQLAPQLSRAERKVEARVADFFKNIFDFESWAPKSTRIWRLQQYQPPGSEDAAAGPSDAPDSMAILSDRISQLRDSPNPSSSSPSSSSSSGGTAVIDPADQPSSSSSSGPFNLPGMSSTSGLDDVDAAKSFSDADDDELSAALGKRISQIATSTGEWSDSMDEEEMRQPLTGEEIRQLLVTKYGKMYDMSFVKRAVPGMKTFVCLNVMWLHLEQQSFKMTTDQYMEKLEGVAAMVNILGQTDKVRAFLKSPAKSQKGLPRRPVVGTAISIRFDLDQAVIDEWFGRGYD